jgi:DNA-binding response OmpR family regulator
VIGTPPAHPTTVLGQHAAEVWARSRERHLRRVEVLERAVLALMDGELNDELRELAESEAHSLASAVGTFGMRAGPRLARALEQSFSARYTLDKALAARLADQVLALRRELERPVLPEMMRAPGGEPHLLMLLSDGGRDDQFVTEGLALGFEVIVRPVRAGAAAIAEESPDAIIVEVSDGPVESVVSLLEALSRRPSGPVLVVSPNDGMAIRLAIAGAGAIGPLLPGLPPAAILERAQAFLTARAQATASVLIVDLEPYGVQLAALVLEQAGDRVHSLGDPARFWETLEAVSPDLVVLGAALGEFSGVDLSCVAVRPQVARAADRLHGRARRGGIGAGRVPRGRR